MVLSFCADSSTTFSVGKPEKPSAQKLVLYSQPDSACPYPRGDLRDRSASWSTVYYGSLIKVPRSLTPVCLDDLRLGYRDTIVLVHDSTADDGIFEFGGNRRKKKHDTHEKQHGAAITRLAPGIFIHHGAVRLRPKDRVGRTVVRVVNQLKFTAEAASMVLASANASLLPPSTEPPPRKVKCNPTMSEEKRVTLLASLDGVLRLEAAMALSGPPPMKQALKAPAEKTAPRNKKAAAAFAKKRKLA